MIYKNQCIPFFGGWFVYLGYEIANEIEKKLVIPKSPYLLPDAFAARACTSIVYDHIEKIVFLSSDKKKSHPDFDDILNDLFGPKIKDSNSSLKGSIKIYSKGTSDEHQSQVRSCIDYIYQGEIFQANLSRLWRFKADHNL